MKLFSFWKNKSKPNLPPKEIMERLIDYMPEIYKTHRQFINSTEFLKHREWELALNSLFELTDETKHYFSEEFWLGLTDVARELKLADKADYCKKQIERNKQEVKFKIPFGWTTKKIDDTHFQDHISEKLKEEWAIERRKRDKVRDLIAKDGIYLKSQGRNGFIYMVDNGQLAEIEFELGVNGLILYFNNMTNWVMPSKQILTVQEKQYIRNSVNNWSIKTNNSIEFDD